MRTAPAGFISLTNKYDSTEEIVVLTDAIMVYERFSKKDVTMLTLKSGARVWVKEHPHEITNMMLQKEQAVV
ncbi:hypothetical protein ZHAWSFBX_CDS_0037 [Agrobacterium phage Alfirin]|nr:hypothetical protein ZHAWSFBX_CDS_0037 [Agrobacterium phage Alfirin]